MIVDGSTSVSIGNETLAVGRNSLCTGYFSNAYLYGQKAHSGNFIGGAIQGNCQYSELNPFKLDTLNSAATTVLSLDGTGTTNSARHHFYNPCAPLPFDPGPHDPRASYTYSCSYYPSLSRLTSNTHFGATQELKRSPRCS